MGDGGKEYVNEIKHFADDLGSFSKGISPLGVLRTIWFVENRGWKLILWRRPNASIQFLLHDGLVHPNGDDGCENVALL